MEGAEGLGRCRGDDLAPAVDGPSIGVTGEQGLDHEVDRRALRIVLHLAEFLEKDLLFAVEVVLAQGRAEEDVLLVPEPEVRVLRGERDLEDRQVLARVAVEVGAVAPNVGRDLGPRPRRRPAEEEAVLEEVDQAARLLGLVLGADVESGDDVDEREVALFVEEDPQAVIQDERAVRPGGRDRPGRRGRGGHEPKAGEDRCPRSAECSKIPAHGHVLE